MTMPRRTFLGFTALAALAAARPAIADPRRILAPPDAAAPVPSGRLPELERAMRGLRIGNATPHGALTVFWLASAAAASPLTIETLQEARASGALAITERPSPTVPELIVDNRGKTHVLLLAGEILVGGKQNRVLREDILLPPLSGPRSLSVYCVEQGRWSGGRKEFESKAYVAQPSLRRKLLDKDDQGRVWAEVDRSVRAQGIVPAPTSSYAQVYEAPEVRRRLDDVERAVDDRAAKGAVGAMVVIGDEVSALDAFQDAGLFSREWRKLLRAHAVEAYGRGVKAVPADEELRKRARALLDAVGGAAGSARGNAGVGQLFEFRLTEFRGAALDYEGRVVHLAVV